MLWLLCMGLLVFVVLSLCFVFAQSYRAAHQHLLLQREVLATLESIKTPDRITRDAALQKARQLQRSRDRVGRLTGMLGFDPSRYFAPLKRNEVEIDRRLRELGVNPAEIDIPPEIRQVDEMVDEAGMLLPPNPTDGRNEDFFQRLRRNQD